MLAPCTELIRRRHPTDAERASLTGQLLREPQPAQIAALVERGADVDCGALARAASEGDVDRTRALLALDADPNNGSPLHAACRAGSLDCVRALRQLTEACFADLLLQDLRRVRMVRGAVSGLNFRLL